MEAMYIEAIPNRDSPPAILLRESYREDGKVKKRTLANLSCLAPQVIEGLKVLLRGGVAVPSAEEVFVVERSLPHGHVAAALTVARQCGAEAWFAAAPEPLRPLLLAMLVARLLTPGSKLATHRMLHDDTATHSLGRVLGVGQVAVEELYRLPDDSDRRTTTLEDGELILEVELPPVEASTYLKAMDRKRWSFPQVGVAAARHADGSTRIALAGVAPIPWRIESADDLTTATPLPRTEWKVPLAQALVRRALAALG